MIPKRIHYCWFGGNPLSEETMRCIESWRKHCPDYEIKEWNENNFNIDCMAYVREAYNTHKYAFVADVVRLKALYDEGGIYMDTDMELTRNIDVFLNDKSFCGFEDDENINAAILGAIPKESWIGELYESYKERHFLKSNGHQDVTTIVKIITRFLLKFGLKRDGLTQCLSNGTMVYSKDYFYPKYYRTGETVYTENTHGIHHCVASWVYQQNPQYILLSKKYHCIPKVIRRHFILTYLGEIKAPLTSRLIAIYRRIFSH